MKELKMENHRTTHVPHCDGQIEMSLPDADQQLFKWLHLS
jgi:hypothetical protein